MRHTSLLLGTVLFAAASSVAQQPASHSALLGSMVDQARPLLIFGGNSDPHVQQQYRELASNTAGLQDRQVRLVFITTAPLQFAAATPAGTVSATRSEKAVLRSQFHVPANTFAVVLVGKDGGEKFRSATPVSFATLSHIIDAMPMRQHEMRAH